MNSWQEDVSSTGKIARSALSISVVTFVSRIFGLLREWTRGYLLGTTGGSDAFSLSFMFPNLLRRLVGEGAMLVAFVPVFAELKERYDEDYIREFVKSFFTLMVFILVTIVLIGYFLAPLLRFFLPEYTKIPGKIELTILLTRIMFPYILFISLAALSQGILNTYGIFVPSAATPILLNVSIISFGFLFWRYFRDPGIALSIGVIFGGMLQFVFPLPFLYKTGIRYGFRTVFRDEGIKKIFTLMVPGIFGAGIYQINVLVSQIIAAMLEEGSVAALRFSNVLVELVLGIFIISISTVILPDLSEKVARGDEEGIRKNLSFALKLVGLITFPATAGLMVLRTEIVTFLFRYGQFGKHSVGLVSYALLFHATGIAGTGATRVLLQMFYSFKDTKTPAIIAAVVMVVNLLLCYYLSRRLSLGGIALAGSVAAYVNLLLLMVILLKRFRKPFDGTVFFGLGKTLISTLIMTVYLYIIRLRFERIIEFNRSFNALFTIGAIVSSLVIYILVNLLLRNREILMIKDILLRKLKP